MFVTSRHKSIVSIEEFERQEVRVFDEETQTESIVSQVLVVSRHYWTEDIPNLGVCGHFVDNNLDKSETVFLVLLLIDSHKS